MLSYISQACVYCVCYSGCGAIPLHEMVVTVCGSGCVVIIYLFIYVNSVLQKNYLMYMTVCIIAHVLLPWCICM